MRSKLSRLVLLVSAVLLGAGAAPVSAASDTPWYAYTLLKGDRGQVVLGASTTPFHILKGETLTVTVKANHVRYAFQHLETNGTWSTVAQGASNDDDTNLATFKYVWPWEYTATGDHEFRTVITTPSGAVDYGKVQIFRTAKVGYVADPETYAKWTLINTNDRAIPTRWDPCKTIPVRMDTKNMKGGSASTAVTDLKAAISLINKNTGLKLSYAGTGSYDGTLTNFPPAGIAITWRTTTGGNTADAMPNYVAAPNAKFAEITKGKVVVSQSQDANVYKSQGSKWRRAMFTHELGHTLGAGHPQSKNSENSFMTAIINTNRALAFGDGDKIWSKVLGSTAGCM